MDYNGLDVDEMQRRVDESYENRQITASWLRRWWGFTEDVGYRISRVRCRMLDRHDKFCRGRGDHTADQRARTE